MEFEKIHGFQQFKRIQVSLENINWIQNYSKEFDFKVNSNKYTVN